MTGWRITSGEHAPATVRRLLRELPEWFGIDEAVDGYVAAAGRLPAYLAWPAAAGDGPGDRAGDRAADGTREGAAGVLLVARHFPQSAEVHLMAVHPAWHRRGAGRALLAAAERDLAADGAKFLQVKTLGPSYPDDGYRKTRAFYSGMGFEPLEELPDLWPDNPCLIMIKTLRPGHGGGG